MHAFDFARPDTVSAAAALLASQPEAKLLAGGQTLIPTLKQRLAQPSHLVDLSAIPGLNGVEIAADHVAIGAMTRHADVATHTGLLAAYPVLAHLAGGIGDAQVRHRGTIGGSLANNDPAADYPAAALALNATLVTNQREIPADAYFQGMFLTALEPGEILTRVVFPNVASAGYEKYRQPASRYALVGVFVARHASGQVRVAVTGAGANGVFRVPALEAALSASFTPDAAKAVTVSAEGLNSDIHGSAEYRAHLIPVLAARAVAKALH